MIGTCSAVLSSLPSDIRLPESCAAAASGAVMRFYNKLGIAELSCRRKQTMSHFVNKYAARTYSKAFRETTPENAELTHRGCNAR
jgi:hypothetical protein